MLLLSGKPGLSRDYAANDLTPQFAGRLRRAGSAFHRIDKRRSTDTKVAFLCDRFLYDTSTVWVSTNDHISCVKCKRCEEWSDAT